MEFKLSREKGGEIGAGLGLKIRKKGGNMSRVGIKTQEKRGKCEQG